MKRDLVIKKLKEYYTLKELFNQKSVQEFVSEEIKTNKYGYAKLLTSLQDYVREFSKIKVGSETIDRYVSRYTGSFKQMSEYSADKYVVNPSKEGYENYLKAAFGCFGDQKGAVDAIGAAFEADGDTKELVSSLPIKVGGSTRKTNANFVTENISLLSSVAGLRGMASETINANAGLKNRIEKLQLRLKDEIAKVKALSDVKNFNGKEFDRINAELADIKTSLESLPEVVRREAERSTRTTADNIYMAKESVEGSIGKATGVVVGETRKSAEATGKKIEDSTKAITDEIGNAKTEIISAVNNKSTVNKKRIGLVKKVATAVVAAALVTAGFVTAWLVKPDKTIDNASAIKDAAKAHEEYSVAEDEQLIKFYAILDKFKESPENVTEEQVDSYLETGKWPTTVSITNLSARQAKAPTTSTSSIENVSYDEIALGNKILDKFVKDDKTGTVEVQGVKFDYYDATNTQKMRDALNLLHKDKIIADLQANVGSLQADVDSLNASTKKLNDQIASLNQQLQNAGNNQQLLAQIQDLQNQVASLNTEIAGLNTEIAAKAAKITELEGQLEDAKNKNALTEKEKADLQAELDKTKGDLDNANAAVDEANAAVDEANGKISNLQSQLDTANSKIATMQAQLDDVQTFINNIKTKPGFENIDGIDDLQAIVTKVQALINNQQTVSDEEYKELKAIVDYVVSEADQFKQIYGMVANAKSQNSEGGVKITETEKKEIQNQINANKADDKKVTYTYFDENGKEVTTTIDSSTDKSQYYLDSEVNLQAAQEAQAAAKKAQADAQKAQAEAAQAQAAAEQAQAEAAENRQIIASLHAYLTSIGYNENSDMLKNLESLYNAYSAMETNFNNKSKAYDTLNNSYNILNNNYTALNNTYNSLKNDYDKLNSDYSSLSNSYNNLNSSYNKLSTDYDKLNNDYNTLSSEKSKVDGQLAQALEKVKALESRISQLNSTIQSLQNKLDSQADYESIKAELESIKALVSGIPEEELNNIASVKTGLEAICRRMGVNPSGKSTFDMLVELGKKIGVPIEKVPTSSDSEQDEKDFGL